jgi:DNA primase
MQAPDYFSFLIARAANTFPVKTPEGKANAIKFLLPYIRRVPQAIIRDELANNVAQKLGIDSALLRQELRHAATTRSAEFKVPPEPQVSEAEKIVIRLLAPGASADIEDLRAAAVEVLVAENLAQGLPSETLLQSLLSPMESENSEWNNRQLASILLQETDELTQELIGSAIEALRRRKLERRKRDLSASIADAERKNDAAQLASLVREKIGIERALRS